MDLVEAVFELRHAEPLRLFRPYWVLYRSLAGKEPPAGDLALPGFQLDVKEKNLRVVVEARRTALVLGDVPNVGYCIDTMMGTLAKISEVVDLPSVLRLGIRTYWIEKSSTQFASLVSLYKQIVYKPSALVDESVDVGASFVVKDGDQSANIAFGPMDLRQLETMLTLKHSGLPSVVKYLDIDYFRVTEPREAVENEVRLFVNSGLRYADEQSRKVSAMFQEARQ